MMNNEVKISRGVFIGVDVGSSYTKLVAVNAKKEIIGWSIRKSGISLSVTSDECLDEVINYTGFKKEDIVKTVSTGYGRKNVVFADMSRTEISCHAKGCFHYFPFAINIVDIGGQDNKVIKLNDRGVRTSFKMNRKCAAGTGAFLEEMSLRLNVPTGDMNEIASSAEGMVQLGSFCTVFSGTEVLKNIGLGKSVGDIVKGLFLSVLQRVIEMESFSNKVVVTGGVVAHNPYLIEMATDLISQSILVPKHPQLTGALGAALCAVE